MPEPRNRLLLIAISEYRYWRPLQGPRQDADALKGVLFGRYGFGPEDTIELRDEAATSEAILTAFRGLKTCHPDDQLLIYYAGHGYTDEFDRTGFWIPHDAETNELRRVGWIPNASVRGALAALPNRHILLICDSCFSGDLLDEKRDLGLHRPPDYAEIARTKRSREVLTSGGSEPVSDVDLGGQSAFAFHLTYTLKTTSEPWVDAVRLYDHIRSGVRGQQPQYGWLRGAAHEQGGALLLVPEGGGESETRRRAKPEGPPSPLPSPPPSQPRKQVCPCCGLRNDPDETFRCRVCGRDYLCQDHFVREKRCCEECAERLEREEQARRAEEARKKAEAAARAEREVRERAEQERRKAEGEKRRQWEDPQPGKVARVELGTGVVVEMVGIPPGEFTMGSPESEKLRDDDEVPHKVKLTRGFWLGKYAVTQAEYEAVMGTNPSRFKGAKRPVERVSWHEAVAFCNALSEREGLTPCYSGSGDNITCNWGANGYRLPTEAEWEYACRAGTRSAFYTGECTEPNGKDPALDRAGWYDKNSGSETHEVGQKAPNAWGLYDMHGNVWEWCWDWYGSEYYSKSPPTDPVGPSGGSGRVFRGGSWSNGARYCRSAYRIGIAPDCRWTNLGFRLARS